MVVALALHLGIELQVFMVFPICFFHAMTVRVAPSALLGEE
jgi:hypothetical protein